MYRNIISSFSFALLRLHMLVVLLLLLGCCCFVCPVFFSGEGARIGGISVIVVLLAHSGNVNSRAHTHI